jgi:flavin-dependent dehydrogenase
MVDPPVMLGPLAVDATSAGSEGLLLAGDAAGFIDPMTGDGLRFAVRGGELAAQAALAQLAGRLSQPHERLTRVRRREFARKWRFNRALRRMVAANFSLEMASTLASAAPWALRRAIRFAADIP